MSVKAQQHDHVIMINQQQIFDNINKDIPKAVKECPASKTAQLRKNVSRSLSKNQCKRILANKPHSKKLSYEEIYARLCKATFSYGSYYNCGNCHNMHASSLATAFAVTEDGICATNYHVLQNFITNQKDAIKGDSAYYVANIDGRCYPMTAILGYSRRDDLAFFQIDTRGDKLDCLPLGDFLPTGSHVNIVANPGEHLYLYSEGIVSRNVIESFRGRETHRMEVSADYGVGASGGPIVDDCCNLVGMVSSTITIYANPIPGQSYRDAQMVVKTTIPVSCFKKLVND